MSDIHESVNNMYKSSVSAKYSGDIWITVIIFIIVFYVLVKYLFSVYSQPIIDDWNNMRCDPTIIPFAGIINAPTGTSAFDFTGRNYDACVQQALKEPAEKTLDRVNKKLRKTSLIFGKLAKEINVNRRLMSDARAELSGYFKNIYDKLGNVTVPIVHSVTKTKDILNKINSTFINSIYTIDGGFISSKRLFIYIYEQVVNILLILHAFILSCFTIGWLFPPTLAVGMGAASFLTMLMIPVVSFITIIDMLGPEFSPNTFSPTTKRRCFSGSTIINTKSRGDIMIKNLNLGEELHDGSIVTALMKSTPKDSKLYIIGDVIVTGTHKIYHNTMGWIDVEQYDDKIPFNNFEEPYVYCIGTNSKVIKIGSLIFSDWDEVDDDMIFKLCVPRHDIHKKMDVGLHPETIIQLKSGRKITIKDIEVNDILICGAVVETVVTVKTDDIIDFCNILYKDEFIVSATKNTEILVETPDALVMIAAPMTPPICYHIVTDVGGFKTSGVFISDYNRGIDKFLD